jgi:hypothetical protein
MTTITITRLNPALDSSSNQTVYLTEAGYETIRLAGITQPACWQWDLIAVNYTGPEGCMVRGEAQVVDSFVDLEDCKAALAALSRMDRGKDVYYTICRHVPVPEPEPLTF